METFVENRKRIQPNDANNYDTAHGGVVMKAMDEIGAMSAMRFAGEPCVTASVDEIDFQRPIPVGGVARIESYVYDHGRSSVKVRLRADREDPLSGECERTTESRFTFVAIDEDGDPTPVPQLQVNSDRGRDLVEEAKRDEE
jgi:acyl-CoA hydrolase